MGDVEGSVCLEDRAGARLKAAPATNVERLLSRGWRTRDEEGNPWLARSWFDSAYHAAHLVGDAAAMGEAALGCAGLWINEQRSSVAHAVLLGRMRHALAAIDPGSPLGLRVRLRLTAETEHGTGTATLRLAEPLHDNADVAVRAEAAGVALQYLAGPEHRALRCGLAGQLVVDGMRYGRRGDGLLGLMWQTVDLLLDGDPSAERTLGDLRAVLAERDHRAVGAVVEAMDVMRLIRAGQLEHAASRAGEGLRAGRLTGDLNAAGRHGSQLVAIRWYQGRIGELAPSLVCLLDSPDVSVRDIWCLGALAVAAATAGDERRARQALVRLDRIGPAELAESSGGMVALYGAIEAAVLLDDRAAAAHAYDLLMPYADRPVMAGLGASCFGSVHHPLGRAALMQGELDRAVAHLTAAVDANLALGHRPAAALARMRLAEALERRCSRADADRAARERQLARHDVDRFGMSVPERTRPAVATGDHVTGSRQPPPVTFRRVGRRWEVTIGGHLARVGPMRGMDYLAVLIANPGREIRAAELAAGPGLPVAAPSPRAAEAVARMTALSQPLLDDVARRTYRHRLVELEEQLEGGAANGNVDHMDRLRRERDWLAAELSAATGRAGRSRAFVDNDERARIAVGKAIRRAVERIAGVNPAVGQRLRETVHTGVRCSYRPYRSR